MNSDTHIKTLDGRTLPICEWLRLLVQEAVDEHFEAEKLPDIDQRPGGADKTALLQAVARGWCHDKNRHKEMDPDLARAIVDEVSKVLEVVESPFPGQVETWKSNTIALAKYHKAKCVDEDCGVALSYLRDMATAAGVEFGDEAKGVFL
jgi:hypothetical protein